jgi:zinc protease
VIGWGHEIENLSREDALAYYRQYYRPDNAILIVAGDVNADEVRVLAEENYGRVARPDNRTPQRARVKEPVIKARRLVTLGDEKVEQPMSQRAYLVPSHATAEGNEAFALELLSQMLGGSQTSRLYRALVLDCGLAVSAGAWYWNDALDMGQFGLYAVPAEGVALEALDAAIDGVLAKLRDEPVEAAELERAKTRLIADMVYAQDSQTHLARIYGATLTTGGKVEDVARWPQEIRKVDAAAVQAVARKYLKLGAAVIGHLVKAA